MRRLLCCLILGLLIVSLWPPLASKGAEGGEGVPQWTAPAYKTVREIGPAPTQATPSYAPNLDCQAVTYAMAPFGDQINGCMVPTSYGLYDLRESAVLFNGSSAAYRVYGNTQTAAILPWPGTANLVGLFPQATGGASVGLYTDALDAMQPLGNGVGEIIGRRVGRQPDVQLMYKDDEKLVLQVESLAFSSNNAWLVAETYNGTFVRINLATLQVAPFANALTTLGNAALGRATTAISDNGQFALVSNSNAGVFTVYDLASCSSATEPCKSYDYLPFLQSHTEPGLRVLHASFVHEGMLQFSTASTEYLLAPQAGIDNLMDYLGMGDSYASGEGTFRYRTGTDEANNRCHTSVLAYPVLLGQSPFSPASSNSVACSGAKLYDIGNTEDRYTGQVHGGKPYSQYKDAPSELQQLYANFSPGLVSQIRFLRRYQPKVTTVMVGGNDVGFTNIIKTCATPHISLNSLTANSCYDTYEDRQELLELIQRQRPKWTALFSQLKRSSPLTRIYAVTYPSLAYDKGDCAVNVRLSRSELGVLQELQDELNNTIAQAAYEAGIQTADIRTAFNSYRLCETSSALIAMNGLTAGSDGGFGNLTFFGAESYHPTVWGHELMANALRSKTQNFSKPSPRILSSPSTLLTTAPRSGRAKRNVIFSSFARPASTKGRVSLAWDARETALPKGSTLTVLIDNKPTGDTVNVNHDYHAIGVVQLPPDTGDVHTIDLTGTDANGQPIVIHDTYEVPQPPASQSSGSTNATTTPPIEPISTTPSSNDNPPLSPDPTSLDTATPLQGYGASGAPVSLRGNGVRSAVHTGAITRNPLQVARSLDNPKLSDARLGKGATRYKNPATSASLTSLFVVKPVYVIVSSVILLAVLLYGRYGGKGSRRI